MTSTSSPDEITSQQALLDLRVPRLRTLPGFIDGSYTRVKLAHGLFKAVKFEPWVDFDSITKRTKESLERLDPVLLECIRKEIRSIRRKIDPTTKHENASLDDALGRLFASSPVGPSVTRNSSEIGSTGLCSPLSPDYAVGSEHNKDLERENDFVGVVYYTNTSSCSRINSKVFDLVENLIRYVRRDPRYLLLSQLQLSSEIGRKYERMLSPKDFCNITPDVALTTTQEHPVRDLPICSFELKGPLREFWRPLHSEKIEKNVSERPTKKHCDKSRSAQGQGASPSDGPDNVSPSQGRKGKPSSYTAKGLADYYNELLDDSTLLTRKSDKSSYYFVFLPIAQAVVQALLTESGCSVLYTHQEAIALEVFRPKGSIASEKAENRPIRVRVSRAFPCDEEPGNICAIVALATYSCDQAANESRRQDVRELFNRLTHRQYEYRLNESPGHASAPGGESAQDLPFSSSTNASRNTKHSAAAIVHSPGSVRRSCDADDIIGSSDRDDAFTKALAEIIETSEGVIGLGSSAIVLGGTYKGYPVAVKSWNGLNRDGLRCLLREIEMYRFLLRKGAMALGNAIPYVRIARAAPEEDAVLVTDRVGETITRATDVTMAFGSRKDLVTLQQSDIEGLGKSAVQSLRLLHDFGILHGDISLQNLRAKRSRQTSVGKNCSWRAWWIDLGLSQQCTARLEMEVELERCVRLFPEADIDSIISTA